MCRWKEGKAEGRGGDWEKEGEEGSGEESSGRGEKGGEGDGKWMLRESKKRAGRDVGE